MSMRVKRMSDTKTRKVHSASFKAKVALEAVRETKTLNEIGQEYGVHPVQVSHWKKALLEKAGEVFEGKRGPQAASEHRDPDHLYSEIGRLKVELDRLKKSPVRACRGEAGVDFPRRPPAVAPAMRCGGRQSRHVLRPSTRHSGG